MNSRLDKFAMAADKIKQEVTTGTSQLEKTTHELSSLDLHALAPSPSVRRFGRRIVQAAGTHPILDVACGGGRNGVLLSHLGGRVIGIDIDLSRVEGEPNNWSNTVLAEARSRISLRRLDLIQDVWPYPQNSIGGIVNIHFFYLPLLTVFTYSLIPGGLLVLETVENRGGNYLQLPKAGVVRSVLEQSLAFPFYEERHAGPLLHDAVTVRLVGRKR